MSHLFTPGKLANLKIKNRLVRAATFEAMAGEHGEATPSLLKVYRQLAKGEVGLIITGMMYVHLQGKAYPRQIGIHNDAMLPGLKSLADAVHKNGGKIIFQLAHSGRQSSREVIGRTPLAPSRSWPDTTYLVWPKAMTEDDILQIIEAFGKATQLAVAAGADGIQLHAANGYLLNQFLSPFFNHRRDAWGGSAENRFRIVKEVYSRVRKVMPAGMPLIVKLNTHEHTPVRGITPELALLYARWLAELGIDALEPAAGTISFSNFHIWRGAVPTRDIVRSLPFWLKPGGYLMLHYMEGKFDFSGGYLIPALKSLRASMGNVPLFSGGGMRTRAEMEEVLNNHTADFIALCRPLIREPLLVKKLREGTSDHADCTSCNRCVAGALNHLETRCYVKGLPIL